MRTIYLLLLISLVCMVSAKYLPDESTSRALLRNKRSFKEETDDTVENQSNESDDDNDDEDSDSFERKKQEEIEKLQLKHAEEQRKLQEKRDKEERKRQEHLEKEQRKREKLEAKIKEQERKLQEKLEKEERKQKDKLAKEELKRVEKIAKQERKHQQQMRKKLEELEIKTLGLENQSIDSSESGEELEFEDIWKNYIYSKYGLVESSTDIEKDAAVYRYLQEEIGLKANSTRNEYRQAVLELVNSKLVGGNSTSVNGFYNYFVSHVNPAYIQNLQADIESTIVELDNDTALLQNVSLPWVPEARLQIGKEKSILTGIAQFLSDIAPTWFTGGKPTTNSSTLHLASGPPSSGISDTGLSNTGFVSSSNEAPVSTPAINNVGAVDVPVDVTESAGSSDPTNHELPAVTSASIDKGSIPNTESFNAVGASSIVNTYDGGSIINSNPDAASSSSSVDVNGSSLVDQSAGSMPDNVALNGTSPISSISVSEGSVINNIPSNLPAAGATYSIVNTVTTDASSSGVPNFDTSISSSTININENSLIDQSIGSTTNTNFPAAPVEVVNTGDASSVVSSSVSDIATIDTSLNGSSDSQFTGSSITILASPSAESSTSIDKQSTGIKDAPGSVTYDADANTQVSNTNIANSSIQTVVESETSSNTSAPVVTGSSTADLALSVGTGITSSNDIVSPVPQSVIVEQSDSLYINQLQGIETVETVSNNPDSSLISTIDTSSTGGQITDSVNAGTGLSVNAVNAAAISSTSIQDTVIVGSEVAVQNTGTSADTTTSSGDTISNAGSSSVSISGTVENVGVPSKFPDVVIPNIVDKPVDTITNTQINTAESIDYTNIISLNSSDKSTDQLSFISTGTEENTANALPANLGPSVNATIESPGTNESIINASDIVSSTIEGQVASTVIPVVTIPIVEVTDIPQTQSTAINELTTGSTPGSSDITIISPDAQESVINITDVVSATNVVTSTSDIAPISTIQEPIPELPVPDTPISGSESEGSEVISNKTVVNDVTVTKEVSFSSQAEINNISVPITTQNSLLVNEVSAAVPVSELSLVTSELPPPTEKLVNVNDSTVVSGTTDSLHLIPVENSAPSESESSSLPPAVNSDTVKSFAPTSANDVSVSNIEVTIAPETETDTGLFVTSYVIRTTEVPQAAQDPNIPTTTGEVGASLLEVTQQ